MTSRTAHSERYQSETHVKAVIHPSMVAQLVMLLRDVGVGRLLACLTETRA